MTLAPLRILLALIALVPPPSFGQNDDDDDDRPRTSARPASPTPAAAADHPHSPTATNATAAAPSAGHVRLSPEQQRAAGIAVQVLTETRQRPEFSAYARVADIQPLLNLATRLRALQAERTVSRTTLGASQKALERTAKLHKEDAASARSLQQAQAQQAGDAARAAAAEQQLAILRTEALQQWGATLAGWAFSPSHPTLERLLLRQDVLVELALPPERTMPAGTEQIRLARQGDKRHTVEGRLVSAAPRTGDITQGETWFAVAPADALRTGMRLDAWVPTEADAVAGVEFPVEAVLWRSGKPWVYLQIDDDRFERRLIPAYTDHGARWFVGTGVAPGDRLVINGAQLLLSEEFRGQIPAEDDD